MQTSGTCRTTVLRCPAPPIDTSRNGCERSGDVLCGINNGCCDSAKRYACGAQCYETLAEANRFCGDTQCLRCGGGNDADPGYVGLDTRHGWTDPAMERGIPGFNFTCTPGMRVQVRCGCSLGGNIISHTQFCSAPVPVPRFVPCPSEVLLLNVDQSACPVGGDAGTAPVIPVGSFVCPASGIIYFYQDVRDVALRSPLRFPSECTWRPL